MRHGEIEQQIREKAARAGDRARGYADDVSSSAQSLFERGRQRVHDRFGKRSKQYGRKLSRATEDFADEANYQYRRLRRQVNRHPAATVAIVAGTIGAFLLLRQVFRSNDED